MFNLTRHLWNALQPLLDQALDLEPAERRAWLNNLRADSPTIARELERLLRQELESSEEQLASDAHHAVPSSPEALGLHR